MHSTIYDEDDRGLITFHHNGDYSGDVWISFNDKAYEIERTLLGGKATTTIKLPYEALRNLVLGHMSSHLIRGLENASFEELMSYFSTNWGTP